MRRKKFAREFKMETVQLLEEGNRTVAELAKDLGIHPNTLYRWRTQFLEDGAEACLGRPVYAVGAAFPVVRLKLLARRQRAFVKMQIL
jgi:transposase-like protein